MAYNEWQRILFNVYWSENISFKTYFMSLSLRVRFDLLSGAEE